MTHASLCFLSFNRPQFIAEAIDSARAAGHPVEIVVHDDGSNHETTSLLHDYVRCGAISRLILNPEGHNEGVGTALNRCIAVSTGDPVVKLDQDLLFQPGWLARCVDWIENDPRVGMFGLFRYHCDPVDFLKMNHRQPQTGSSEYEYVDDFVGSAMVIPRWVLDEFGSFPEHSDAFAEDVEYKGNLQAAGIELALPVEDLAVNRGFGIGPSTVVVAPATVQTIRHGTTVL